MKPLSYPKLFFCFFLIFVCVFPTCAFGIVIESDVGHLIFENELLRMAYASGQGTSSYFKDPISNEDVVTAVLGGDSVSNKWVTTTWSYYADGFGADVSEEGDLFTGVWATAKMTHSKIGETQSNQYVYDSVSANSRSVFEFSMIPYDDDSNLYYCEKEIPTNIGVKMILEVEGSEKEDMGNAQGIFYLEHITKTGKTALIRYADLTRRAIEGEDNPVTFPLDAQKMDWPGSWNIISDDGEQTDILFPNVPLRCNERYRIRMYVHAGAYSVFRAKDTSSSSEASAVIDPNFEIDPTFEFADKFKMIVSSGVINENSMSEPKIILEMQQDGENITNVNVNGGPVTCIAPMTNQVGDTRFFWSTLTPGFVDIDGDLFNNQFVFDPSKIEKGDYRIHLMTLPSLSPSRGSLSFQVFSDPHNLPNDTIGEDYDFLPLVMVLLIPVIGSVVWIFYKKKRNTKPQTINGF